MSNTDLIIEERSRDIGDFLVGRLIPFRKKRMVGPFIFVDHMGPAPIGPTKYADVDQHPHVGLSTLTYLFEGEIEHRDSIGTVQRIAPGSVNWMTAGSGVAHTERTPTDLRNGQQSTLHGYQIWVALPKEKEDMTPVFHHVPSAELPTWQENGASFKLVAGKGFGKTSTLPVHSDLFMVEVIAGEDLALRIDGELEGEIGVIVCEGSLTACGNRVDKGNMLVSKSEDVCHLDVAAGSHLLFIGGQPFPEERFIYWNFVSHSLEKLEAAKQRWRDRQFPPVPGDSTYIPMPEWKGKMK